MGYKVHVDGSVEELAVRGHYAGHSGYKIFGTLDCGTGRRMDSENRVFFLGMDDAVVEGYRPCKNCRPVDAEDFAEVYELVSEGRKEEWRDYLEYTGENEVLEEEFPEVYDDFFGSSD